MTRRATARGAERTPFTPGMRADVVIAGASFAGLAAARALAGSGAEVLVLDRYAIGERQTSACAVPSPWIEALGLQAAVRQELGAMGFHTPHGSHRFRLPWSWAAFDYAELCRLLWESSDAVFATAKVEGRTGMTVHTDRGDVEAGYLIDALGWRRVLGSGPVVQPPEATVSRGLEVHPPIVPGPHAVDLDIWVDRSLVRYGYAWNVPAGDEQRVGAGSYEPRHHVKQPTIEATRRLGLEPDGYQGNWFPHRLRPATEDGVLFAGDSAGHCLPLTGEGIRTALHFGTAAGTEVRAALAGTQTREQALARYASASRRLRPIFELAFALQWLMPRLAPKVLDGLLDVLSRPRLCRPAAAFYLRFAAPAAAGGGGYRGAE